MQYYKSQPQETSTLNRTSYVSELSLKEKLQIYFAKDGYQSATILSIYALFSIVLSGTMLYKLGLSGIKQSVGVLLLWIIIGVIFASYTMCTDGKDCVAWNCLY